MRAADALAALAKMGLVLRPIEDKLYVEPRDRITPLARSLIIEHRDALLRLVREIPGPFSGPASFAAVSAGHDPAPVLAAYHERLPLVLETGDIMETEAHQIAATGAGASLDALAQRQAAFWRRPSSDERTIDVIISRTWSARSPDARCGLPCFAADSMSARPMPRCWGTVAFFSGTSRQSEAMSERICTGPPKVFGSGTERVASEP